MCVSAPSASERRRRAEPGQAHSRPGGLLRAGGRRRSRRHYAGRGESPGIWAGRGGEELGVAGVVHDGELGTLLRGFDPASGNRLRTPVRHRTITVERIDPETGKLVDEKRLAPVASFDLVFSCPKSVSLLHALTEDVEARQAVSEAHEAAWRAALRYLEREACVTRCGEGGTIRERAGGFVCAAFKHRTSRAQDPHLHTHVIVANLARSPDGEWRALDGNAFCGHTASPPGTSTS
jgi:hypothetical protein